MCRALLTDVVVVTVRTEPIVMGCRREDAVNDQNDQPAIRFAIRFTAASALGRFSIDTAAFRRWVAGRDDYFDTISVALWGLHVLVVAVRSRGGGFPRFRRPGGFPRGGRSPDPSTGVRQWVGPVRVRCQAPTGSSEWGNGSWV